MINGMVHCMVPLRLNKVLRQAWSEVAVYDEITEDTLHQGVA